MRFHQNFNEMSIRPYGLGYEAPSTALYNTEQATIKISSDDELLTGPEIIKVPEFIELTVEIIPTPFVEKNYTATYQFNEIIWPEVLLYPPEEVQFVSKIELVYTGIANVRFEGKTQPIMVHSTNIEGFELSVKAWEVLYKHQFDYENSSIKFHVIEKHVVIPIWTVGGFYQPGCPLDQIQQVFCSLSEQNQQTVVRKTTLAQWNEQGFYPPNRTERDGQSTVFQTPRTNIYLKFIETIRQGNIRLNLLGANASELDRAICFTYKSFDITEQSPNKAIVHFIKE